MAVLRVTRRHARLLGAVVLLALILAVGPPKSSVSANGLARGVDFGPALASEDVKPDLSEPAAQALHRLQPGTWATGTGPRDLPVLQVTTREALSAARPNELLEAAIAEQLRRLHGEATVTRRVVFGTTLGAELRSTRQGAYEQTLWIAMHGQSAYVAAVLHQPEQAREAESVLDTLRFAD